LSLSERVTRTILIRKSTKKKEKEFNSNQIIGDCAIATAKATA